jgi:hypothetical protein
MSEMEVLMGVILILLIAVVIWAVVFVSAKRSADGVTLEGLGVSLAISVVAIIAWGWLLNNTPSLSDSQFIKQGEVAFLGFIVALAAYLANVGQKVKEKIGSTTGGEKEKHKKNLYYIIVGEQLLVIIGVLAAIRVGTFPVTGTIPSYDFFLTVFLAVIICYLAFLHMRQWSH